MLRPTHLSILEILLLIFTSTLVASGIVIANINSVWFEEVYAVEDGFVENWTLVPLLVACCYALYNLATLGKHRHWHFKSLMVLIALFCFFVAGEEISWGQRIFQIESSTFFKVNNTQAETNLHNMVIGDKKVNKIIFSQLLTVLVAIYLFVLPWLYRKNKTIRHYVDLYGVPIAQLYQVIACFILFSSILLIPSGKNAEILEAGITTLFLLIFLFPYNALAFKRKAAVRFVPLEKGLVC
ncbi:hypothetical protein PQ465_04640 [Sphingobacterium oryzagri]|uniref:Uncharacterized protein n=1 Tax=Sphingobacterium oryzagri TaxID=3025669 RepID=A0ABY7WMN4_9SPHI|nr:hypothetical protein [Sphingobacterium sp. KACC 22765]WDF69671.1 hypothetical protein PQ465_04640 [Sphingobacterium sp. KACC 22765]